jgi:hypothetical protein
MPQSCGDPTVMLPVLAGGQVFQPRNLKLNEFIVKGLVTHSFDHYTHSTVIFIPFEILVL